MEIVRGEKVYLVFFILFGLRFFVIFVFVFVVSGSIVVIWFWGRISYNVWYRVDF